MAVFTKLQRAELEAFVELYDLGSLTGFQGIAEGTENSNFIVKLNDSEYVLTLVERGSTRQLMFVIELLERLRHAGLYVPFVIANRAGEKYQKLSGRPALLQPLLKGEHVKSTEKWHCAEVGDWLARMHLITLKNTLIHDSDRGIDWMLVNGVRLNRELSGTARVLLKKALFEVIDLKEIIMVLPKANIHADLFRDNVFFQGDRLTGVIDFFNACSGPMLYDLAIAVNDWCSKSDGSLDDTRTRALLDAYSQRRQFTQLEIDLWPVMLRVASLRFWLSRLIVSKMRVGHGMNARDPEEFRKKLEANQHVEIELTNCSS